MDDYVLSGTVPQHIDQEESNPLKRYKPLTEWIDARYEQGVDSYSRYTSTKIAPEIRSHGRKGDPYEGINFASQEYLSLSTHPAVIAAAKEAMDTYGVHSAGSAALQGNTALSIELERKIAAFTGYADCTLFPTGWAAGYGIVRTLTRRTDHIIIDILAHACLYEGATTSTENIHVCPHLSTEAVERRLQRIRKTDTKNAIIVITESTFSMDSDVPDMKALQALCRRYDATLVVDCAHDLGAIGPTGRGYLEIQDFVGGPDVLMGSFSKTFASNGGFVCTNATELKLGIRYNCGPHTFSNAMSPVNAAIVGKCFDIIDSEEGAALRAKLMENIVLLRQLMREKGFEVLGRESAIVPVILGDNRLSRLITKYTLEAGGIVNLVEYPAVSKNTCRWRLQVMANHTEDHIRRFVEIAAQARDRATKELSGKDAA